MTRNTAGGLLFTFCVVSPLAAQSSDKIDFRRDVQPLIEKNCIGCHGPEQQMNAFRLDRRSAAIRGGTRSVIVPGNSSASRLYLRLIGNQFGTRMPTTGPLSPHDVSIFKAWIDQGAAWPDDLANEPVVTAPDSQAVRITDALRAGNNDLVSKLIAEHPQALNAGGPNGSTPLMFAVLYSDAHLVESMLNNGADPNRRNNAQASALLWAANDLEKTRSLLKHGADVNAVSTDGRTALLIASGIAGNSAVVQFLLEQGANPNPKGRSPGDSSPLHEAANAGDLASMKLLIAKGASIKSAGAGALSGALEAKCSPCSDLLSKGLVEKQFTQALLSVAVSSDVDSVRYVLDHGANVNVADLDGRTALMYAANNDRLSYETVKLLIDHGADVNAKNREGFYALDAARLHGKTPIVSLLEKLGANGSTLSQEAASVPKPADISVAINRAIPLLQKADISFTRKSGCVSCHNEALTEMALATARQRGFQINNQTEIEEVKAVTSFFGEWQERLLQGMAPGGPAYTLQGLHAQQYKPDLLTDSIARYLKMHQLSDGRWGVGCGGSRNPLCGDEVTNTANSLRAIQLYAPATNRAEYQKAVDKAAAWLKTATVRTHEDRTFRLFGLVWADSNQETVKKAVADLLATQRSDGGWSDNPYMSSTAYATGEALVALQGAGLAMTDAARQRGVKFLLQTQREDGSWHVKSHSYGTQPYFDNGFPYGVDQWISAAATNWATMALALSLPPAETNSARLLPPRQ